MARQKSFFEAIEAQGRQVLKLIEQEIADLEGRLGELREQAARWTAAVGLSRRGGRRGPGRPPGPAKATKVPGAKKRAKRTSPPVDWDAVLKRLPKRFSKADLERATPKLKAHPQARVIAVARWARSGHIKKTGDGQYQKV